MSTPHLKLGLMLAAGLLTAGCAPTLTVVPHMTGCEVSDKLRAGKCALPRQLPDDATFATLVDTMLVERPALRECAALVDALRDSLQRCNQATADFNKTIDEINARNQAVK